MEIKTTGEIYSEIQFRLTHTKVVPVDTLNEMRKQKWVAVDDVLHEIKAHDMCIEHHIVQVGADKKEFTCLDIIYDSLFNSRPSGADNKDSLNYRNLPKSTGSLDSKTTPKVCPYCDGKGKVCRPHASIPYLEECINCKGTGKTS